MGVNASSPLGVLSFSPTRPEVLVAPQAPQRGLCALWTPMFGNVPGIVMEHPRETLGRTAVRPYVRGSRPLHPRFFSSLRMTGATPLCTTRSWKKLVQNSCADAWTCRVGHDYNTAAADSISRPESAPPEAEGCPTQCYRLPGPEALCLLISTSIRNTASWTASAAFLNW